ncbi:hypothetical protein [Gordonia sp. FQ]|uniref:hypothetical protein n=1 Tax=Gordonia sp. FQ TaxID=3446634 RepID=UPI003F83A1CF
MRWIDPAKTLELTSRNITALAGKLDDPRSARMLSSGRIAVHAVDEATAADVEAAARERIIVLTRAQLACLADEGTSITVAGTTIVTVPDAAHYTDRPPGPIAMPSSDTAGQPDTPPRRLRHLCEVCGADQILTPDEAFDAGWDYPPRIGVFGAIGPRICGRCGVTETVWWALVIDGYTPDMLRPDQKATIARIATEPESIIAPET